jgi:tetratricopeptide (TPR) repeat protein
VIDAVHEIREEIVRAVISALELQIPLHEAQMAQWKSPNDLDAWAAYHLGLRHMYRFTNEDNQRATALFERAAKLDPTFARAYAGLSFTHFQDAFLHYEEDRDKAVRLTQHFAELSLEHDPLDPFGNFVMGRSHWLEGDVDGGVPWLDRANRLNPNYAQAKYVSGALQALLCRGDKSETDVEQAVSLSPLDPLLYAMLTTRALSYIVRGDAARGAAWAERGARSPGAHGIIEMIAVAAHGLNGDDARAKAWAASVRARAPRLTRADFERVFTFRDEAVRAELSAQLARQGF